MAKSKGRVKLPDINRLRKLYASATRPDSEGGSKSSRTRAQNELQRIEKDMRRIALERMRNLKKRGYDYGVEYDSLAYQREKNKGSLAPVVAKNATPEQKAAATFERAMQERAFLESKQSTISGQKAVELKRFETFTAHYKEHFSVMSDDAKVNFLRFLGEDAVSEYIDGVADSGETVEMLMDMFNTAGSEKKVRDLFALHAQYLEDEQNGIPSRDRAGLSHFELKEELNKLYEDSVYRRR